MGTILDGEKIKKLKKLHREKTGLNITNRFIAKKCNVSFVTVASWLKGETNPDINKAGILLTIFNVRYEDITKEE
jgi:transcriptional regulator with XRE-family HTH domain